MFIWSRCNFLLQFSKRFILLEFDEISMNLYVGVGNTGLYFIKYSIMKISTILMILFETLSKKLWGFITEWFGTEKSLMDLKVLHFFQRVKIGRCIKQKNWQRTKIKWLSKTCFALRQRCELYLTNSCVCFWIFSSSRQWCYSG